MRIVYNAKVAVKLLVSFFILVGAMVIIGFVAMKEMKVINDANTFLYENNYLCTVAVDNIDTIISDARLMTLKAIVPEADLINTTDENIKEIDEIGKKTTEYLEFYEANIIDNEDRDLFNTLKRMISEYRIVRSNALEMAQDGKYKEAQKYNTDVIVPKVTAVQDQINKLVEYNSGSAKGSVDSAQVGYEASVRQMIMVLVGASVFAVLLGILISKVITTPLKEVNIVSSRIAEGDLTAQIKSRFLKYKDEIGDVSRNIEKMKNGLLATVAGIKSSTDDLSRQVKETNHTLNNLNASITDTSAATEELSASMEETGASAQEMNATAEEIGNVVDNIATMAGEGAAKAGEINVRAEELGTNVKESIQKSERIFKEIRENLEKALEESKAVNEINALADAILGITSQTNLLALNASIEAARAGEAGKGFAVVANEIGTLADDSKNTVTQIQTITKVVMSAVNNLTSSANGLLKFVSEDVNTDYQNVMEAAQSYNTDAVYVSDMTSDLSATSEQLAASIQAMMTTINEVSSAAQEGARTTTSVADQTSEIANDASTIVDNMEDTRHTAEGLEALVDKFIL